MARILLVDDDEILRTTIASSLASLGHDVVTACNGRDALQKFEEIEVDLVLTDIFMPEMDGIEVVLDLCRNKGTRVVAMSGGGIGGLNMLEAAGRLGAVRTLEKPFSLSMLQETLDDALAR